MDQRKLNIAEAQLKAALERKHGEAEKSIDVRMRVPLAQFLLLKHFALEVGMNPMHFMLACGMRDGLSRERTLPFEVTLAMGKGVAKKNVDTHPDYSPTLQHFLLKSFGQTIPNFEAAARAPRRGGRNNPKDLKPPELFSNLDGDGLRKANEQLNSIDEKLSRMEEDTDE